MITKEQYDNLSEVGKNRVNMMSQIYYLWMSLGIDFNKLEYELVRSGKKENNE